MTQQMKSVPEGTTGYIVASRSLAKNMAEGMAIVITHREKTI